MVFHTPHEWSMPTSRTSKREVTGSTMSAKCASFSNHGCCKSTNSRFSLRRAFRYSLPPFQQVDQQGVSDQIMCRNGSPSRGN